MTSERTGTGTARFIPRESTGQRDPFGIAQPPTRQPFQGGLPQARFEIIGRDHRRMTATWRLTYFDLRGGLNLTRGGLLEHHTRSSFSSLDSRFEGQMILPLQTELQASPDPVFQAGGDPLQLSHLNIFGTLVMAAGGQQNACLFKETSPTDPTLIALSYDFNVGGTFHNIYGLAAVAVDGEEPQLCVFGGKPAEVLSNVNALPTLDGTISDSGLTYGVIQTPLPEQPILFYESRQIGYLNAASAYSDQITKTIDVPTGGGYGIGLSALAGGRLRAFWVFPRRDSIGMLTMGSERPGDVYSTSLEGYDLTRHEIPIRYVLYAAIYRDGLIVSDGKRIVFYSGRVLRDTRIFADREPDSDRELHVRGIYVHDGTELIARLNDVSVDGSADTVEWLESYDFDLDAWLPVSARTTLSSVGLQGLNAPGSLPVSQSTGYLHNYSVGSWRRQYVPPYGTNPYGMRQTEGAGAGTGRLFSPTGTWRGPESLFPAQYERVPKIIDRFIFGGEDNLGDVTVSAGGMTHTFAGPVNKRSRIREFSSNRTRFQYLDTQVSLSQPAANTRTTPQALPIAIEGRAFLEPQRSGQWRGW